MPRVVVVASVVVVSSAVVELSDSSRGIIYASSDKNDFGMKAREKVLEMNNQISQSYSF